MLMSSRIIWSDNGSLKDLSVGLNNFVSGTEVVDFVAAEDYLFVGSDFPFNHKFIDVGVANDQSSSVSVDVWDGTQWKAAVDIIDQTSVGGVALSQSGILSWRPDQNEAWVRDDTNLDGDVITGLSGVKIFGLYWVRISFSNDLKALTSLKFVGQKFCEDSDLFVHYPDFSLSNVKTQFKAGKTNWNEQEYQASSEIVRDLKKMNVALSGSQILEWETFKDAACHKSAAIIYNAFGKDFFENADRAEKKYREAMENGIKMIDVGNDARIDVVERVTKDGWLSR